MQSASFRVTKIFELPSEYSTPVRYPRYLHKRLGRKQITRKYLQKHVRDHTEAGAHPLSEGFPEQMGIQHQTAAEGEFFAAQPFKVTRCNQYLDWSTAANRCEKRYWGPRLLPVAPRGIVRRHDVGSVHRRHAQRIRARQLNRASRSMALPVPPVHRPADSAPQPQPSAQVQHASPQTKQSRARRKWVWLTDRLCILSVSYFG